MTERELLRKIAKKKCITTKCACGGKLLRITGYLNYCDKCGQDHNRVEEGKNRFEPIFNLSQKKIMGRMGG